MIKEIEELSEEERRALRGSKFAPLPSLPRPSQPQPRLAHPGGPLTTNKAVALAKFLGRKLKETNGLASINPDLLQLAVNNAKQTVSGTASGSSNSERSIRHVESFDDCDVEDSSEDAKEEISELKEHGQKNKKRKKKKKDKKRKKNMNQKIGDDSVSAVVKKKSKKKVKL